MLKVFGVKSCCLKKLLSKRIAFYKFNSNAAMKVFMIIEEKKFKNEQLFNIDTKLVLSLSYPPRFMSQKV